MFNFMLFEQGEAENSVQTVPDSTAAFHVLLPTLIISW